MVVFTSADGWEFWAEVLWLCSLQPVLGSFGGGAVVVFTPADGGAS